MILAVFAVSLLTAVIGVVLLTPRLHQACSFCPYGG